MAAHIVGSGGQEECRVDASRIKDPTQCRESVTRPSIRIDIDTKAQLHAPVGASVGAGDAARVRT